MKPIDLDLPPEYCHYQDEGCELAPSCLRCPFPSCRYDIVAGRRGGAQEFRDTEIRRLRRQGLNIGDLAARFGVSKRTIHRALRRKS